MNSATGPVPPSARPASRMRVERSAAMVGGVVAIAIIAQLVLSSSGLTTSLLQVVAGLAIAAAAVHAALRAHRIIRPTWLLLATGILLAVSADLVLTAWRLAGDLPPPLPSPIHMLYLIGGIATATGLISIVRPSERAHAALIDAVLVSLSFGALVWPVVVQPLWHWTSATYPRLYLVGYAAVHLAIAFGVVRLLLHHRPRHLGHWWMMAGGTVHVVTAAAAAAMINADRYVIGGLQEAGWLAGHGLIAMALIHPSAREAIVRGSSVVDRATPTRALALFAVTMLLPVAIARDAYADRSLMLAIVVGLIVALLSLRMWLLLHQVARAHHRNLASQSARDQRRFSALVRHTTDILLVVDPTGAVTYANPAASRLYGGDPTGWTTRRIADYLHPDDRSRVVKEILTYVDSADTTEPARLHARLAGASESEQYIDIVVADLTGDPDVGGVVITIQDTTERTELEGQLRHLAFHDSLTDLGNRALFRARLDEALERTRRSDRRLAVFMCDLDDFKDINDTLGHAVGDRLLSEIAGLLSTATRGSDTVARLGGDEFAIVFEDVGPSRDVITLARRVLDCTRNPVQVDHHQLRVGMSIGIAVDDGSRTAEDLLRDADIALYEAKAQGKRRWAVHHTSMTERNILRLQIGDDLVNALADRELDVHYQPVYDLPTGRLVGVEALARWQHPERGPLTPSEFIPIAEQSGLITAVGEFVLDHALTTLQRCGQTRPGLVLRMGVNVSPRELREPALVDRVIKQMRAYGIRPGSLILEITEGGMLEDTTMALAVMRQLREHGVRFAVDDFGTGYSSLSYLRRLPVDIVKIDRSFVEELGDDALAGDLVRAITNLGRTLKLDVCAEGVETEAQRTQLTEMGCRFAQGFLFAVPESADALVERIADPATLVVLDGSETTPISAEAGVHHARTVAWSQDAPS